MLPGCRALDMRMPRAHACSQGASGIGPVTGKPPGYAGASLPYGGVQAPARAGESSESLGL